MNGYQIVTEALRKTYVKDLIAAYSKYNDSLENNVKARNNMVKTCTRNIKRNPRTKNASKFQIMMYCSAEFDMWIATESIKWITKVQRQYISNAVDKEAMADKVEYLLGINTEFLNKKRVQQKHTLKQMSQPVTIIDDPVIGKVKKSENGSFVGKDKQLKLPTEFYIGEKDIDELRDEYQKLKKYFRHINKELIKKAIPEVEEIIKEKADPRKFKITSIQYNNSEANEKDEREWKIGFTYQHPKIDGIWSSVDMAPTPPVAYIDYIP